MSQRRPRVSFSLFFSLLLLLLSSGFCYLGIRLISSGTWQSSSSHVLWFLLTLPFASILWLPLVHWRSRSQKMSKAHQAMISLSYGSLAFLSFLLLAAFARDILLFGASTVMFGVSHLSPIMGRGPATCQFSLGWLQGREASLVLLSCAFLLYVWGRWECFRTPRVKRVEIPVAKLPAELEGYRLVQLSDVHVGPTIRGPFVARIVAKVNSLNPDVVALTGDIVDGRVADLRDEVEPFSKLSARDGKFFVTGNHEYYWGAEEWSEEMKRLGISPLLNTHRLICRGQARVCMAGVPDFWGEPPSETQSGESLPAADAKILLAHQPKSIFSAAQNGFDLQLSGHTHGGQFLPWTLFIRFFQPFVRGLNRYGSMWLYVSCGTGSWGPPVRLGARSEITLLTLVNAERAPAPKTRKTLPLKPSFS